MKKYGMGSANSATSKEQKEEKDSKNRIFKIKHNFNWNTQH